MADKYQLEDASGFILLEDGSGNLILEQQAAAAGTDLPNHIGGIWHNVPRVSNSNNTRGHR